jgi:hypothetical protein
MEVLWYTAVQPRWSRPTFQRCLLLPTSGRRAYTALHARKLSPSHLSPWEPEISRTETLLLLNTYLKHLKTLLANTLHCSDLRCHWYYSHALLSQVSWQPNEWQAKGQTGKRFLYEQRFLNCGPRLSASCFRGKFIAKIVRHWTNEKYTYKCLC